MLLHCNKLLVKVIAWLVVIFGINTTSAISKLLYVRRVKYETVLKYHEWYCICLSSLHYLSSPRWINRYWPHIAGMGSEGVTLRWTIWTNIPLRGEYAVCCKNLVNLQLYGFCQGRRSPGRLKKKRFYPPPHFTLASPLQVISSPPPLPAAWETFSPSLFLGSFPTLPVYPVQIKCTLFVYLCSYLSSGAVRHASRISYLILH